MSKRQFKIKSIDWGAFVISLSVAVVVMTTGVITRYPIIDLMIFVLALGVVVYFVSRVVIRKFIIYKIKPIYQIALSRNIKTSDLEAELSNHRNMVAQISDELSQWNDRNSKEIRQLKESEKYRKEFIGNLSHEIKTPIFNIQGYILTLLDGGVYDPAINVKYLERAEKSIDRLINIVNDLEEISRLESGVWHLQRERFDIVALAEEIAEENEMEAYKRGIRIVVGKGVGVNNQHIMVNADKHYIEQVLSNLVVNSIKYGRDNGSTRISFIDLFDKVMIEVEDDGIGIAKENLPRVFERFFRTDNSRSREQGGTGLGLSIVKHIIEAHQEKITLRSEIDKGTTFSFTLSKN